MIGFVFVDRSPRAVTVETARELAAPIPVGTQVVGLFSDAPPAFISETARRVPLDKIQLHGHETQEEIKSVRQSTGRPVIVARGISDESDVTVLETLPGDMFLLDAKAPSGAEAQGGNATAFDWSLARSYQGKRPWLLAGGLTPDNVENAINAVRNVPGFAGVDVSSGVEQGRGKKDADLIRAFVRTAKKALR